MDLYGPELYRMVLYGPAWSSMVLHEISDNYTSQHEITHNSIRKLEKNKKTLNNTIYPDIAKYDTRYLMLDHMSYHKILIDRSFSNELYPCAPIVRLVIFISSLSYFSESKNSQLAASENQNINLGIVNMSNEGISNISLAEWITLLQFCIQILLVMRLRIVLK